MAPTLTVKASSRILEGFLGKQMLTGHLRRVEYLDNVVIDCAACSYIKSSMCFMQQ